LKCSDAIRSSTLKIDPARDSAPEIGFPSTGKTCKGRDGQQSCTLSLFAAHRPVADSEHRSVHPRERTETFR
jgi:hypothetical protein